MRSAGLLNALNSYEAVLQALDEVCMESGRDDSQTKARGLREHFSSCQMYWSLLVAKEIFEPTERLSKCLQSSSMTVNGAIEAVKVVHSLLIATRSDDKFVEIMQNVGNAQIKYSLEPLSLPRLRRPPRRIDDGAAHVELAVDEYYRKQFFEVIDKVIMCLKYRFIENNDLHLFPEVENILIQSSSSTTSDDDGVNRIGEIFTDIDTSGLSTEMNMLRKCQTNGTIDKFNNLQSMVEAFMVKPPEVLALFPEIIKVINLLVVVPATSGGSRGEHRGHVHPPQTEKM
jgi:hypothetical protein